MLVETVEPQVEDEITQQTPKPAAQEPLAVPALVLHSEEVRQVPIVVEELVLVHSSLGNCTILNKENCSKHIIFTKMEQNYLSILYIITVP